MRINLSEKEKFILRVAGVFTKNNLVLLHRADHEDIWALPGGACEFYEDSSLAFIREMQEELSASTEIKNLAFTVENFFEWNGQKVHEIGLYHLAKFVGESEKFYDQKEFFGIEDKMNGLTAFKLHFKWFDINELPKVNVKPEFLVTNLKNLSDNSVHIVNRS